MSVWHLIERNHSLTAYQGEKWENALKGADEDRQDKWGTLHIIHHSAGLKVKSNVLMCERVMEQVMTGQDRLILSKAVQRSGSLVPQEHLCSFLCTLLDFVVY